MQSRNGQPSRPGGTAGGGAVHAQPPNGQLTSENPQRPPGTGDGGPAADDIQVVLPAATGQLPPDRPRPPEPPGPPPPIPDELPRRHADPSRPSVPSRLSRPSVPSRLSRPPPAAPEAGPQGRPEPPAPCVRPLPPELFRPLWWQERPGPAGQPQPQPSPEPSQPEPSQPEASQPEASQPEASQPGPRPSGQHPPAEPSWVSVLAATMRLWLRRRLGGVRRSRPAWARWLAVLVAGLVAAAVLAATATTVLSGRGGQGAGPAAVARQRAAAWVAGQASPDTIVACDPAMCAALQAHGVPAGRLLVLTPARADPLGSDLVVATAAVRGQFGARLAGVYAPVTVASFGSGTARIDVPVVAPDAAAAYRAALAADVRARAAAGAQLLRNRSVHISAAARPALADGEVDSRLLVVLAALAHLHPLDITGFGRPSPGASAGVPLRSADIAGAAPPGPGTPVSPRGLMTILQAQRPPYLPSSLAIVRTGPAGAQDRVPGPEPTRAAGIRPLRQADAPPGSAPAGARYQPRSRHSARCGRSAPSVVSLPWPG
jgi:hypothetical protein